MRYTREATTLKSIKTIEMGSNGEADLRPQCDKNMNRNIRKRGKSASESLKIDTMSAMETNGSSVGYDARPTALVNGGMVELRGKTLQLWSRCGSGAHPWRS